MKRFAAFLSLWAALLGLIAPLGAQSLVPPSAPATGWWETALYNTSESFSTSDAACRRAMEVYARNATYSPPTYATPYDDHCHWTGGLIYPSTVDFHCPANAQRTDFRTCIRREDVVPECHCKGQPVSGGPLPSVGHPIALATGSESEAEADYSTADGLLVVNRFYRSIQRGRPSPADHELPGFGFAWHGIVPGRIIISGDNEETAEFHDDTGTIDFFQAPSDLNSYSYAEQGISRRKLSIIGTPASNRIDFFKNGASASGGSAEMRMDFSNGEYILFRRSDVFRSKATLRYLIPIEHGYASGYKQWFDYSDAGEFPTTVHDSFGRQILIDWQDVPNFGNPYSYKVVSKLHLPDGTALSYQYDRPVPAQQAQYYVGGRQDRLVLAKHLDASGTTMWRHSYLYEDTRFFYALTAVVDQNGQKISNHTYSDAGLAASTQLAGGFDKYSVEYLQDDPSQRLQHYIRNVTGPLGQVETYAFFRDEGAPAGMVPTLTRIDRAASATVPASSQLFSYTNTNGTDFLLSSTQDPRGITSAMTVDTANRRPTAGTEAQGTSVARSVNTTWHTLLDLPTHEERQGLTTDYSYSTTGQLLSRTETDTTTQAIPYSTNGQTRTVTYSWDSNGRLLSINGPLAVDGQGHDDLVAFTYDASGNRSTMTDGLGHVTHYDNYDANGRPGTMTDMNGVVTAFSYDGLGRVKTITAKHPSNASLDAITTIDYDVEGRLAGMTRPATEKLFFDYNLAGLMTSMRSADGERIDYSYDAMGNVTSETVKRVDGSPARSRVRTFDSLGRLLSEALGPQRVTRWAYDANGNVTTLTNPANNATTQAFDPLDRLMSTVSSDGGTTALSYDQKDAVVQNTDPKSVATTFVRNGFGDVIQEVSPDRGTSTYWYDVAGEVTRSQDGRGQIVDYTRDILGRVTQKMPQGHALEAVAYSWDAGGLSGSYGVDRLGAITDASGTTQFAYDHRGNVIAQQQAIGSSSAAQLAYAYDLGDRVTQITYPSGRIVQYGRDTKGRVNLVQTKASASVGTWTVIADSFAYEPFAAVKAIRLGNGLSVANDWGNDGRLASRRLYRTSYGTNLSWLTYSYDPNDNIAAIADQLDDTRSVLYGYDMNDRLSLTVLTAGTVQPGTDSYSYAAGTNQLSSIANGSGTRTFGYDGRGNLANESRAGSVGVTAGYDSYGRLTNYARTDVGTLSFVYNGREDRVAMTSVASGTRHFVYDKDERIMGEYGASVTDVKAEFVWMLPEAANDNGLFGGGDGLGGYMPIAVATPDGSGAIQLNWVHGNHFGVPVVTTDGSGNNATTPNDYLAPGFPGQSRTLADVYYNRYRDYDPSTGRYVQADPIGLKGGQNIYTYAANNPIRFTDPMGLDSTTWYNPAGGRSWKDGPTNGNWGGKCWSGGRFSCGPGGMPYAPPTDSGDECYMRHDNCYTKCHGDKACMANCDHRLVRDLDALPSDPKRWPQPPRPGTDGDSGRFSRYARCYFGGECRPW